jgi:hypothetical protein
MAILTTQELKASREAIQGGVSDEPEPDIEAAIASAQRSLNLLLGYKVEVDDTSLTVRAPIRGERLTSPQWIRSVSAVTQDGTSTSVDNLHIDGFTLTDFSQFYGTVVLTGTFGFATGTDEYEAAKEWVLKAAVDELRQTQADGGDIPEYVEGVTAEGVSLRFGPERRPDLADLLKKLPQHPSKSSGSLYTISLTGGSPELPHIERVFKGLETVDDL